jgi:glyoxylase-like metal-dependent hydrolase (beta-lactamase superfamily II)
MKAPGDSGLEDGSVYELVAIKYATNQRRAVRENFLAPHDMHDGPMPMDFFVWAAISTDRVVLIDGGSDEATCARRGHQFLRCPAGALAEVGIDPMAVTDLVVTHMHWDHMGNIDKFPSAKLHIHKDELAHATGCGMCHPLLRRPYDVDQVCSVVKALYGGRVEFNHGECQIAPGITAHHVGGHTPGLQVVRIRTRRGHVVLASDAMHYYANAVTGNPFPVVVDVQHYLDAFNTINSLADSTQHVIAGHDPQVMQLFPAWSQSSSGFAIRLDAEPLGSIPLGFARR